MEILYIENPNEEKTIEELHYDFKSIVMIWPQLLDNHDWPIV